MRDGARNGIRWRICHSFSTRDGLGRCLRIARPGGRRGWRVPSGGAMNDAQLHAPPVADIDNPGIFVAGSLRLFGGADLVDLDRKSTRLNSSHLGISYAVFCLKKKKT